MIRWIKKHPAITNVIVGAWAFFATATSLVLGFMTYQDSASLDRLEGREKLDKFMAEARLNYSARCVQNTEKLRPTWQARFDALLDIAKVDSDQAPYNRLCKFIAPAKEPGGFSVSYQSSKSSPTNTDWDAFIESEDKNASLWVGEIPLIINVSSLDFQSFKSDYQKMIEELRACESSEQAKSENTFINISCFYGIDKDNEVVMTYSTTEIK